MCLLHRHKQDCKLETTATNLAKDALEIASCQCFAYQARVFAGNYLSKNKNTRDLITSAPLSVGRLALWHTEASAMGALGCSAGEKPQPAAAGSVLMAGECGLGCPLHWQLFLPVPVPLIHAEAAGAATSPLPAVLPSSCPVPPLPTAGTHCLNPLHLLESFSVPAESCEPASEIV